MSRPRLASAVGESARRDFSALSTGSSDSAPDPFGSRCGTWAWISIPMRVSVAASNCFASSPRMPSSSAPRAASLATIVRGIIKARARSRLSQPMMSVSRFTAASAWSA